METKYHALAILTVMMLLGLVLVGKHLPITTSLPANAAPNVAAMDLGSFNIATPRPTPAHPFADLDAAPYKHPHPADAEANHNSNQYAATIPHTHARYVHLGRPPGRRRRSACRHLPAP